MQLVSTLFTKHQNNDKQGY